MSPVLASSDPISGNLLAELSTFVGREVELEELTDLQARTRLLTLVGPGGVGKSRLAVRLAATLRRNQQDGIWLVDLAHVSRSAHVPQAVAEALDVHEQAGRSWDTILTERLRARHVLLVLDNCDHVLTPTRELVDTLLLACPELSILVTSRQQLGALGERVWRVQPLAMSEAVQLFVD
jgi:predicted ATPase